MKKKYSLIVLLFGVYAAAQTGKVGINTATPTEIFHVNGTARIESLPVSGTGNIYNGTSTQNVTFTGTQTVVADNNGNLGVVSGLPSNGIENSYWYNAPNSSTTMNLGTGSYIYNSDVLIYTSQLNASSSKVTVNLPTASSSNAGKWFNVCNIGNSGGGSYSPTITLSGLLNMQYGSSSFGSTASTNVNNTSGQRCVRVISSLAPNGNYYWVTVSSN